MNASAGRRPIIFAFSVSPLTAGVMGTVPATSENAGASYPANETSSPQPRLAQEDGTWLSPDSETQDSTHRLLSWIGNGLGFSRI
jgi:hypothetical protein